MKSYRPSLGFQNPLRARFDDEFFSRIPECAGVYFMRGKRNRILYVGKAKCLRKRLQSYRTAKPGSVGENIIELLEYVRAIEWEVHESEESAFRRELELIRALTPVYNIADCWEEDYLFIGVRERPSGAIDFRLTSDVELGSEGEFEYFGCFQNRRKTKSAYLSLLRLLYAAANRKERFSFPAKIARFQPPYEYSPRDPPPTSGAAAIRKFFRGEDDALLGLLIEALLDNETIPPFVRPGLQEDFDALRDFYQHHVRPYRTEGRVPELVTHEELRVRIRESISPAKPGWVTPRSA